jgi:hypothetical protein
MVLKAKLVIVAIETPLDLVRVSKISAGTIHDSGPLVAEKQKLYIHVMTMKPQDAPVLSAMPGGNLASRMVAMIKVTQFPRLPPIIAHLRPVRSMNRMQQNCATSAMMEDMPIVNE